MTEPAVRKIRISDILYISDPTGLSLLTQEDFELHIEAPVRPACLLLHGMGIFTSCSTGNSSSIGKFAAVTIFGKTIAAANAERLRKLQRLYPENIHSYSDGDIEIRLPVPNGNISPDEISAQLCALIDKAQLLPQPAFRYQPVSLQKAVTEHLELKPLFESMTFDPASGEVEADIDLLKEKDWILPTVISGIYVENGAVMFDAGRIDAAQLPQLAEDLKGYAGLHLDLESCQAYTSEGCVSYYRECLENAAPGTQLRAKLSQARNR